MVPGKNIGKFSNTGSTFLSNFLPSFFIFYFSLLLGVELRITKKLHQGWVRVAIQIGLFLGNGTWEKHREIFEYWVHFFVQFFAQFYFSLLLEVELRITKKLHQG